MRVRVNSSLFTASLDETQEAGAFLRKRSGMCRNASSQTCTFPCSEECKHKNNILSFLYSLSLYHTSLLIPLEQKTLCCFSE